MICPSCNKEITEESNICPHCMSKIKSSLSPFEKYDKVMQKHLSGMIFLALTIAATLLSISFLFVFFEQLKIGLFQGFVSTVPLIVSIITTVGLWTTWINAKKGKVRIRENRGKIMCLSTYNYIVAGISLVLTIILGLLALYLVSSAGKLANSFIDFSEIFDLLGIRNARDLTDTLVENTIVVLVLFIAFIVATIIIFMARYNALKKIIDRICSGYVNDRIPYYSSDFYSISSYIYAFVFCAIAFAASSNIFSIFQYLMYAVTLVLSGILFMTVKREIYDCYIEQQREIIGNN